MNCKLHIPVMNGMIDTQEARAAFLSEFKTAGADIIYLCPERDLLCREDRCEELRILQENVDYFKANGFEVGVWIQAFGFGVPATPSMAPVIEHCTKIKSIFGDVCGDAFCPTDKLYMEYFTRQVSEIAQLNPDIILLDDDLCLSVRPGIGCFCDNHLSLLANELGENIIGKDGKAHEPIKPSDKQIQFSELAGLLFCGAPNKYRTAWLKVMGDSLRDFCAQVRAAIDVINPKIRAGFCAGYTSFDFEGASADELSLILSGKNTKPILRLTGAPYWAVNTNNRFRDQRLHTIIEFVRAQEYWCRPYGIELFHEGDVFPRPRTIIPAAWLECYDGALRASGNINSFKYMLDYTTAPGYETGYTKFHLRNMPVYRVLDSNFADKPAIGVQIYEIQHKTKELTLPDLFIGEGLIMQRAFSPSAAFITENGIPATYDTSDVGIAFGVNAKELTSLLGTKNAPKKLILDIPAALELQNSGFDLGIASCEKYSTDQEITELFGNLTDAEYKQGKRRISIHKFYIGDLFSVKLKEQTTVQSRFMIGPERIPASFTYTCNGTEFLIFAFDGYTVSQSGGFFVSYERQRQLLDFCGGFPYIAGCPFVYSLAKRDNKETDVFFANINDDAMFDFDIVLERDYSEFEIITPTGQPIDGVMSDGKIHIDSTLPPYGMFALILKNQ